MSLPKYLTAGEREAGVILVALVPPMTWPMCSSPQEARQASTTWETREEADTHFHRGPVLAQEHILRQASEVRPQRIRQEHFQCSRKGHLRASHRAASAQALELAPLRNDALQLAPLRCDAFGQLHQQERDG